MELDGQDEGWLIRDLAPQERPRERLLELGGGALSDLELLAVLLRTGDRRRSVLEVSRRLLVELGGLAGLQAACPGALRSQGLGTAKSSTVLAAVELGRRLARLAMPERLTLSRPRAVADYLALRYCEPVQEIMGALFLDRRQRLMGESEIFRGTIGRISVEPRAILKQALLRDASSILLFHTHPSGDPGPSLEDWLFTRNLADAAKTLGLQLVDHLILGGPGRWVSLQQLQSW